MNDTLFQSPSQPNLDLPTVLSLIKDFIKEDESARYKLTIGTDSEFKKDKSNKKTLELVSAIVIYRKGYGGRYFWRKKYIPMVHTLRDKIYEEVLLSLDVAKILVPELKTKLNGYQYDLEIHIDVGEHGATREMIKEVVGIVTGSGYIARTKPYSYAASNIADRHA